mgnify:CR=1 FL=1
MNIINKVRHVFPYLYYRAYNYFVSLDPLCGADLRAWFLVGFIKTLYFISFVSAPLLEFGIVENPFFILLCVLTATALFTIDKKKHQKYKEMFVLWKKKESKSQRRLRGVFLIIFCMFSFLSIILTDYIFIWIAKII